MTLPMKKLPRQLPLTNGRLLRLPAVCELTGLGRSMIYLLESQGSFPQRIKITERAVAWLENEIRAWIAKRIEQTRGRPQKLTAIQGGAEQRTLDLS